MIYAIGLSLILVVASVVIHYEVLRAVSLATPNMMVRPRARILVVIGFVFVAHLAEITLFALGYGGMQFLLGVGMLTGATEGNILDYFYFSASSYTTLGMGDLFPSGEMRIIAAIESLAGLVLIGWSASFTYLAMEKFWDIH